MAKSATKSNVFVNITQPYVDMGSARVADMLLPTDDMPFGIDPTPMTDILAATKANERIAPNDPTNLTTFAQAAKMMLAEAKEKATAAQTRIWDWMVESHWHSEMRQVIEDAARIGTGIIKGPYPTLVKSRAVVRNEDGTTSLKFETKMQPAVKRIDPWNFYPDAACGRSIHNGSETWEADEISGRQLREMKEQFHADGTPMYLIGEIDAILREGPNRKYEKDASCQQSDNDQYKIWYMHGIATAENIRAAGCECDDADTVSVIVTMVNDRVIRASQNILDSGDFPYGVFVWQRQANTWTGKGISRQMRTPQRIVNAATRNMLDNAGLSAGPIIVIRRGALETADGTPFELRPRMILYADDETDVTKAVTSIEIPSRQNELMGIINYGMELAEKVTNMPLLMQGQQEPNAETLGGQQMRQNNASVVLRRTAKIFDDDVTVPTVTRFYEYLLIHGDRNDEKGDYQIRARGATALYERDAQHQSILQMGGLVKDPAFRMNPEKWAKEFLKAQRLDPALFQYSDDEWEAKQAVMQEQGQPVDPRIETAKIAAEARIKTAEIGAEVAVARTRADTDRDTVYVEAQEARDVTNAQIRMEELRLKRELAMLEYTNRERISLETLKAKLADSTMKVQAQRELSAMSVQADMHKSRSTPQIATAPTEPAGRADAGEAYQA
ncbi:MAG TPA: hypothetical protein VIT67_09320 [Povalibacter sp.]